MKFFFYTLGCRVNQFETAAMEEELKSRGHEIVSDGADVVVVNSCAVTAESARKSRQAARRLLTNNPGALLAVCGCWPQAEPVQALDSGAVLISGSGGRLQFIESLEKLAVKSELLSSPMSPDSAGSLRFCLRKIGGQNQSVFKGTGRLP